MKATPSWSSPLPRHTGRGRREGGRKEKMGKKKSQNKRGATESNKVISIPPPRRPSFPFPPQARSRPHRPAFTQSKRAWGLASMRPMGSSGCESPEPWVRAREGGRRVRWGSRRQGGRLCDANPTGRPACAHVGVKRGCGGGRGAGGGDIDGGGGGRGAGGGYVRGAGVQGLERGMGGGRGRRSEACQCMSLSEGPGYSPLSWPRSRKSSSTKRIMAA